MKRLKTLNESICVYVSVYVYIYIHIYRYMYTYTWFFKHSSTEQNEEKGKILDDPGQTGAETLSIYLSIHLSLCLHTSDGVGFPHRLFFS